MLPALFQKRESEMLGRVKKNPAPRAVVRSLKIQSKYKVY